MAISELAQEIDTIVENSFNPGMDPIIPSDVEHILNTPSDVIHKRKSPLLEFTV
ncbi:MAG: hypothetical protein ACW9XA_05000 [Candidatus Nitrosopumilus sp. bin_6a]